MIHTIAMWFAIFILLRGVIILAIDIRRGEYSEHSKYLLRCLGIDPERGEHAPQQPKGDS